MERILRNKEIFEIIPFDYEQKILYFPIRHHSPACSFHLIYAIHAYKPDCILVEGPQTANQLIPILTDENTSLPVAFYYFYKDTKKLISEDGNDYKCYYPFLNTSPEYNALLWAKKLNIESSFIDLPYGEILIHTAENTGFRTEREIQSYNDDYYLSQNTVFKTLCEKTGMRNFEEFWEKYFEIDALYISTEEFVARMMSYCYLARQNTPEEEIIVDGCLKREQYMASNIRKASEKYNRILVVTGGFHTPGLYELMHTEKKTEEIKLHRFSNEIQNVYATAYSLEAADALNGYAAGMQNPGFYELVWQKLKEKMEIQKECAEVYKNAVLDTLLKAAKAANKENLLITMSDIAAAVTMYEGLSMLRDKKAPGLYELYDSVRSCFVKGELNAASDIPLKILSKIATGNKIGKLCPQAPKAPLLKNFEELCEKYKLKIVTVMEQKIELDLFAKPKHMEISQFFYQMNFLHTDFAKRIKGADIIQNKDRSRIREIWSYSHSIKTDSALIDASAYGATIKEACTMLAVKHLNREQKCSAAAKLYVECFLMGIDVSEKFLEKMEDIIISDGDFFSIGKGIYYFNMLKMLRHLYHSEQKAGEQFLEKCFQKILIMLPSMVHIKTEQAEECIKICKMLYQFVSNGSLNREYPELFEAFQKMIEASNPEPALYGAILGLLYGKDVSYKSNIRYALKGYLTGSEEMHQKGAVFLRGLFYTARDIVLVGNEFVRMINELIKTFSMEEFMEVLPELKLAFSYFVPSEIDTIAEKVAVLYQKDAEEVKRSLEIDMDLYAIGAELEKEICEEIGWGV